MDTYDFKRKRNKEISNSFKDLVDKEVTVCSPK